MSQSDTLLLIYGREKVNYVVASKTVLLFLKQPLIFPSLYHKSAITCQIDSYQVSNSKLNPDLSSCVKTDTLV